MDVNAGSFLAPFGKWAPLLIIGVAILLGLIYEAAVSPALLRRANERKWTVGAAVVDALRGVVVLWSAAAGVYLALLFAPLEPNHETLAGRALTILLIWSVTVVAARIGVRLVGSYNASRKHVARTASLFTTLTGIAVYAMGTLIVLQSLGISIAPLLAALGVGGVAVALALRDTLTNFFSGLQIIASDRLHVGDFVRLDDLREGRVTDVTWLHTTLRDDDDNLVVVPNENIASETFTNLSMPSASTKMTLRVNLAYGNDLERVEAVALDVARSLKSEVAPLGPEPVVRIVGAKETGLDFALSFSVPRYSDCDRIRHELYKRLFARFGQERIALAQQPWALLEVEDKPQP